MKKKVSKQYTKYLMSQNVGMQLHKQSRRKYTKMFVVVLSVSLESRMVCICSFLNFGFFYLFLFFKFSVIKCWFFFF